MGQEFRHILAGWFWLRVFYKTARKIPAGTVVSHQGLAGEGSAFRFIGCCQASGPSWVWIRSISSLPCRSLIGLWGKCTTWQLVCARASKQEQKTNLRQYPKSHCLFVTSLHSDKPSLSSYVLVSSEPLGPAHSPREGIVQGCGHLELRIIFGAACHKV